MKKFLTVLLALSVVFTYTFGAAGSVFAATSKTPNYDAARTAVLAELDASYNSATTVLKDESKVYSVDGTTYNIKLDAKALKDVALKVYNDYKEVIQKQYEKLVKDGNDAGSIDLAKAAFTGDSNKVDIDYLDITNAYYGQVAGYDNFLNVVYGTDSAQLYLDNLLNVLLPYTQNYVAAELDKVDLGAYSDAVMNKGEAFEITYAEKAAQVVKDAKDYVAGIKFTDTTAAKEKAATLATVTDAIAAITSFKTDGKVDGTTAIPTWGRITAGNEKIALKPSAGFETIDGDKVTTKYLIEGVDALKTSDALKGDEAQDAANRAAYKAYVEKKYAEKYAEYLKAGTVDKNIANLDKYKAVALAIIEEGTIAQAERWGTEGEFDAQLAAAPGRYDVYADAEKRAATFKLATDKTGELLFDAAVIDKNMKDLKMKVYYEAKSPVSNEDILEGASITADRFAWDKEVALARTEADRKAALGADDKYYAPEKEKINALFDKRVDEINACTTSRQIAVVTKDDVTVPSTIKTAETIVAEFKTALSSGLKTELELAKNYIEAKNHGKLSNDPNLIVIDDNSLNALMAETFAENGARTNTAAKGMMDKVYAAIEAYPAQGAQKANVKAVQDAIDALPATITNAEKETVKAAFNAYEALTDQEKAKVDTARLNKAIAALKKIAEDEIKAAIKALPAKLTAADKSKVEAVQALIDAYDEETLWDNKWTKGELKDEFDAVRAAELKDVIEAIYKLGENPSADAVKAARKAYDAYVEYWTDAEAGDNAADDVINDKTLFYAEAQVKANIIKATEALKLSVSTKLYTKSNKIRVNWKVKDGDASYIDGYQVYKSTKAQKNYKFMGKTKKSYMDNKKNLKKGTRYFYKVRAYVEIDGQKYYSDWSNKGNRIYK